MKKLLLINLLLITISLSYGQQWNGSIESNGTIYREGNVGIGVSPYSKLTLGGSGQVLNFLINKKLSGSWPSVVELRTMTIQSSGSSAGNLAFATGNSEKMRISANGRVGIGTSNPSSKLSVYGEIAKLTTSGYDNTFDNFIKYGHKSDLESGTSNVNRWHGIDATITAGSAASNKLKFRLYGGGFENEAPIDVMTLTGNGRVGIGTTNPQSLLAVDGTITSKEVKVTLDGWSDFVFNNNYELKDLNEVEDFINNNKRLPEIPSESEVIENGINLGEMDAKLLQKIEELTLYMIEMNKRVNSLEAENSELKEELKGIKSVQ